MPLPSLIGWEATGQSLHNSARLLGAIRQLLFKPMPNYLHLALKIEPLALSTDTLPGDSKVILNFRSAQIEVHRGDEVVAIPLGNHSTTSLFVAVLQALKDSELANVLNGTGTLIDQFVTALSSRGSDVSGLKALLVDQSPLVVDSQLSRDYGQAFDSVFTGVARFRAQLNGSMTPVVVWPHHFDISFLWFATDKADENAPHLNFGFSPPGGGVDEPYFYAYAYPMPDGIEFPDLPAPAYWHTEGWKGIVLKYKPIAETANPEIYVEEMAGRIYRILNSLLK